MIDTHSHMYMDDYAEDIDAAVMRAREAGVEKIFLPGVNLDTVQPIREMCLKYPGYCLPMIGLHPEDVTADWSQDLDEMEKILDENDDYIAVGEIGLDFYRDREFEKEQILAFERQVMWARKRNLPLMIHCRSAQNELMLALKRQGGEGMKGVFHCFSGSPEQAREILRMPGYCLGIGGLLTFKNCHLRETLADVPLDRVVLETDCPWLAPTPFRGQRNESAYVAIVMQKLAEVYSVTPNEVESVTNDNVRRVFGDI